MIIGNPPYQVRDGGGTGSSAKPIYQHFVAQAKKLRPRFISMVIPSRWFSGGKGLDDFRRDMLHDRRLSALVDFSDSSECFPGVDIAGGVCYFLWDRDHDGGCEVSHVHHGTEDRSIRFLNEFETHIRDSVSRSIVMKVRSVTSFYVESIVSSRRPFGIDCKARPGNAGDCTLVWSGGKGPFLSSHVSRGRELIDTWKVIISKASYDHGGQPDKEGRRRIFSRVEAVGPGVVCSETYLVVGACESREHAENLAWYLCTSFARFLVSTVLFTQNISKERFAHVPLLDMSRRWSDRELYDLYSLSTEEIEFIERMMRPMKQAFGQ